MAHTSILGRWHRRLRRHLKKSAVARDMSPLWLAVGALAVIAVALLGAWGFYSNVPTKWSVVIHVSQLDDEAFIYPNGCPNDPDTEGPGFVVNDEPGSHASYSSGEAIPLPEMPRTSVIVMRVRNLGGETRFRALLTERRTSKRIVELAPTVIPSVAPGIVYVAAIYADGQPAPLPQSCGLQMTSQTVIFDAEHHSGSWPIFTPSAARDNRLGRLSFALFSLAIMLVLTTSQARRRLLGSQHQRSDSQILLALTFAGGLAAAVFFADKGIIYAGTVGMVAMVVTSWLAHQVELRKASTENR